MDDGGEVMDCESEGTCGNEESMGKAMRSLFLENCFPKEMRVHLQITKSTLMFLGMFDSFFHSPANLPTLLEERLIIYFPRISCPPVKENHRNSQKMEDIISSPTSCVSL